jgi:membrane fusion protein, multidrug efflux system
MMTMIRCSRKRMYSGRFVEFLLLAAVFFCPSGCGKGQPQGAPAPQGVEVAAAVQKDIPVYSEWIASMDGSVNATIRAQVQGYLVGRNYQEGNLVRKGQILFEIDPRSFQAAFDQAEAAWRQAQAARSQAEAALEQAKADVAQVEARYDTAKSHLDRIRPLAEKNAVSQKDLDDAIGAHKTGDAAVLAARAAVAAGRASLEASQAAVLASRAAREKAGLDLDFTKVLSPVDGIAGIAKAQIGNLVGPGSVEELTTVSTVDPIRVYIPVSEKEYLRNVQNGGSPSGQLRLDLTLADGTVHPHKGVFAFTDRQVDGRTGTIKIAALFPNPGNILRPGQFARVRAPLGVRKGAVLVPQRAVTEIQGTYQVAVVGPENKVDIRPVKVGERIGALWVVDEGVNPGEQVIAEGVQKVKQGTIVTPRPFASEGSRASTGGSESAPAAAKNGRPPQATGRR